MLLVGRLLPRLPAPSVIAVTGLMSLGYFFELGRIKGWPFSSNAPTGKDKIDPVANPRALITPLLEIFLGIRKRFPKANHSQGENNIPKGKFTLRF